MTFTVTDALMSPMGLAVLTGAGLIKPAANDPAHVHVTINKSLNGGVATVSLADLQEETGLYTAEDFHICTLSDVKPFATKLDGSGAGIDWFDDVTIEGAEGVEFIEVKEGSDAKFTVKNADGNAATGTVQLDFYLIMNNKNAVTEVDIAPESFGGFFYVEAQTLFRREDTGKDMAAEIIIPKAKVQSAFTFTMAASGDPSTFDFVMDAMPGYLRFDHTKKLMCKFQILGSDNEGGAEEEAHTHTEFPEPVSPDIDGLSSFNGGVEKVSADAPTLTTGMKTNQNKATVTKITEGINEAITLTIAGGINSLTLVEPKENWGNGRWVALDYNTGESTLEGISYINRGTTTVLGADDIADATALGLGAGHMVVWVKADVAKTTPATFSLEKGDKRINVTIKGVDGE